MSCDFQDGLTIFFDCEKDAGGILVESERIAQRRSLEKVMRKTRSFVRESEEK
ncbi:MAG: hypothetical protein ACJAT3_002689 [Akkermansiaceae bacterium]